MTELNKIAYCGLFCGTCKIFLATQNGTLDKLSKETKIPVELLRCNGCRSTEVSLFCRNCAMKKCCSQKGLFTCADCEEFPCSVLKAFENDQHQHHKGVVVLLNDLKQNGETKWIEIQKERWSCNNCGHPFSWYDKNCENCNEKVDGLEK